MKTYQFSICGLRIRVDSEYDFNEETNGCLFLNSDPVTDVHVTMKSVQKIPNPEGMPCKSNREYPVWRNHDQISRVCWDLFRPDPHFLAEYDLHNPTEISCSVRQDSWIWATREKYLWNGIQLQYLLLHHRGMIFHASYIGYEGSGIVFTAPSQTGKSTQARLWQQHLSAEILNGDKAGIHLGEIPTVCGVPFSGTSGICQNVSLPLKAIVVLSQAPENTVRRMKPIEAIQALCPNLFVDQAITEEWHIAMRLLMDLVEQVPVYALACTPDERAVETLYREIYGEN